MAQLHKRPFFILDVFTTRRLEGNPLCVVTDASELTTERMQMIAAEFNLSETVFLLPAEADSHTAKLRIFTPKHEMPFAGHPTIGTALLLSQMKATSDGVLDTVVLELQSGLVSVDISTDNHGQAYAEFESPGLPHILQSEGDATLFAKALGLEVAQLGFAEHKPIFIEAAGNTWLFVPVNSLDSLAAAQTNMAFWQDMKHGHNVIGAYIYTKSPNDDSADYQARMFAPDFGVAEDPATGAAAVTFSGCLMAFDKLGDGVHTFAIKQGYEMGRPSQITLKLNVRNTQLEKVVLGGSAVKISEGTIFV